MRVPQKEIKWCQIIEENFLLKHANKKCIYVKWKEYRYIFLQLFLYNTAKKIIFGIYIVG